MATLAPTRNSAQASSAGSVPVGLVWRSQRSGGQPHNDVEFDIPSAIAAPFVPNLGSLVAGSWFSEVLRELGELVGLSDNWDGYGAPPVSTSSVLAALKFLSSIGSFGLQTPAVAATGLGNVQLEWHLAGHELDVEFDSKDRYEAIYEGPLGGREWEGDVSNVDPVLARLISAMR